MLLVLFKQSILTIMLQSHKRIGSFVDLWSLSTCNNTASFALRSLSVIPDHMPQISKQHHLLVTPIFLRNPWHIVNTFHVGQMANIFKSKNNDTYHPEAIIMRLF